MTPTTAQHVSHPATTQLSQFHLTQQLTKSEEKRTHLGITIRWSVQRLPMAARPRLTLVSSASLLILVGGV